MFFGNDVAKVYRPMPGTRSRDGDQDYPYSHDVVGCLFQPKEISGWLGSEKSDGGQSMYAVEADAKLYLQPEADIREGDFVEVGGRYHQVTSPAIVHRYPSGHIPGKVAYLVEVRKW